MKFLPYFILLIMLSSCASALSHEVSECASGISSENEKDCSNGDMYDEDADVGAPFHMEDSD